MDGFIIFDPLQCYLIQARAIPPASFHLKLENRKVSLPYDKRQGALTLLVLPALSGPYWAVCCTHIGREVCLGYRCPHKDSLHGCAGHYSIVDAFVLSTLADKWTRLYLSSLYLNACPSSAGCSPPDFHSHA